MPHPFSPKNPSPEALRDRAVEILKEEIENDGIIDGWARGFYSINELASRLESLWFTSRRRVAREAEAGEECA